MKRFVCHPYNNKLSKRHKLCWKILDTKTNSIVVIYRQKKKACEVTRSINGSEFIPYHQFK